MNIQIHLSGLIVLTSYIYLSLQTKINYPKTNFIFELSNGTIRSVFQTNSSLCVSNDDCPMNSQCKQNKCQCIKGWLTWNSYRICSYKQSSKFFSFMISLVVGGAGIDWFVLSRGDVLYILTGVVKLLISIAASIWTVLAIINKTEASMILASCFSMNLILIGVIWWMVDWIRILLNKFPDGNGAPLIS